MELMALRARISRAAFSNDKIYRVTMANGQEYLGSCYHEHLFHLDGTIIRPEEVNDRTKDEHIDGLVSCLTVQDLDGDQVVVNMPCCPGDSSDNVAVHRRDLLSRPGSVAWVEANKAVALADKDATIARLRQALANHGYQPNCEHCGMSKVIGTKCKGDDQCVYGPDGKEAETCENWGDYCCKCGASFARGQLP